MIATLLAAALGLAAADPSGAERAYRAGDYGEALRLFEAVLREPGVAPGPVLYNLGNCAFRLGRHADAVLYYRRARLRLPGDAAVESNLRRAEARLGVAEPSGDSAAARLLSRLDSASGGWLVALVAALQSIGLAGVVSLRRTAARAAMLGLVALGLAVAARVVQTRWFAGPPEGVVLGSEVAVRPEPHIEQPVTLRLQAGTLVRIAEKSDRWARIEHPRGGGWTERAGLGVID